jgi:hypothetical protein
MRCGKHSQLTATLIACVVIPSLVAVETPWNHGIVSFSEVDVATEADTASNTLTSALIGTEYRTWRQVTDPMWIGFGVGATLLRYESDANATRTPIVAWGRVGGSYFIREWLACSGQVALGWSGELGADSDEAVQVFATLGPEIYTASDRSIFLGVMLRTRAEQAPRIIPLITVDWRFNAQWRVQILDQIDQISRLRYRWHPQWETNLRLDLALHSFALDDDQAAALADEHSTLAVEFGWHPAEDSRNVIRAYVGSTLQRQMTYRDQSGNLLLEQDFDPSICLGMSARLYF